MLAAASLSGSCTVIMRCGRWVGTLPPLPPPPLLTVLPATSLSDLPAGLYAVWRPAAVWRLAAVCWLVRRHRVTGLPFTPPCCWQPCLLPCADVHVSRPRRRPLCCVFGPARCPHGPSARLPAASVHPCFRVPTPCSPAAAAAAGTRSAASSCTSRTQAATTAGGRPQPSAPTTRRPPMCCRCETSQQAPNWLPRNNSSVVPLASDAQLVVARLKWLGPALPQAVATLCDAF